MDATFAITLNGEQFNTLAAKLKSMGFGPDALEKGTLPETRGVVLSYVVQASSSPVQAVVTFTVIKRPFLVTVGMIENAVKQEMGLV